MHVCNRSGAVCIRKYRNILVCTAEWWPWKSEYRLRVLRMERICIKQSAGKLSSKCYQLGFRLKSVRRALDVVRNSLHISLSRYSWKFRGMIFLPFRLARGICSNRIIKSMLRLAIIFLCCWRNCTYLMSSMSAGDFFLMIGMIVSTIHWFLQSHSQLLKRKSISSTSSQRPSKSCGNTVKLLLYRMSCAMDKYMKSIGCLCITYWWNWSAYRGEWWP